MGLCASQLSQIGACKTSHSNSYSLTVSHLMGSDKTSKTSTTRSHIALHSKLKRFAEKNKTKTCPLLDGDGYTDI